MTGLRYLTLAFGCLAAGILATAGAGLGAYLYDPSAHSFHIPSGFEDLAFSTQVGITVFWPLGFCVAAVAILKLLRTRSERTLITWVLLMLLACVSGILVGLMTTILSGHSPRLI